MKKLLPVLATALLLSGCINTSKSNTPRKALAVIQDAPEFQLKNVLGGEPLRSKDFKGKVVVVDFWATWCVPCTQELPYYQTLYSRYQAQDFHVVAISMDAASTVTRVGPAARRLGITFDVVTDLDTRVTSQLNPRCSAPFSIWVNREGRITWEMEGFSPAQHAAVESGIRTLVTGS